MQFDCKAMHSRSHYCIGTLLAVIFLTSSLIKQQIPSALRCPEQK